MIDVHDRILAGASPGVHAPEGRRQVLARETRLGPCASMTATWRPRPSRPGDQSVRRSWKPESVPPTRTGRRRRTSCRTAARVSCRRPGRRP
jgi:hypothetical protein